MATGAENGTQGNGKVSDVKNECKAKFGKCYCVNCSEARMERDASVAYKSYEQEQEWKAEQWDRMGVQ
ncbi:MAG: hypothetical protein UY48_C0049G0005 [Candidatus Gottesmanbacteria bacterium GW2011_GWB1_49_7]|uniref:Uncharacterized protein n=1 Tax=Candidatus Gottesmanbacteria bacterium GW2011_GWB1_49_7 TaxID=1618448 RepID=A0A0G1Y574_9BACT|nr:MAG: hypothetical protein UY48_C0049G0005 [Candidatus Gottesmanbacteria bacterium GW2011_GWB1_49_7]